MNKIPDTLLLEALDLMEQGLSVDDILARFPQQAADLRPFLMTAATLPGLAAQPTLAAERDSKQAFLAEADRLAAEPRRSRPTRGLLQRLLAPALAVLAVIFLGGAGLARASTAAVPGDALYQTKLLIEEARINLTGDPERAAELRRRFSQERIDEIERLLAGGREAEVSLTGEITTMDGEAWTVGGVPVIVPAEATVDGAPSIGAQVQIDGRTSGGVVVARHVTLLSGQKQPPPAPAPEASPVPTSGPSPAPDATRGPTPAATPVVTEPPPPPSPTSASPTATPDHDDDDDDDADDTDDADDPVDDDSDSDNDTDTDSSSDNDTDTDSDNNDDNDDNDTDSDSDNNDDSDTNSDSDNNDADSDTDSDDNGNSVSDDTNG